MSRKIELIFLGLGTLRQELGVVAASAATRADRRPIRMGSIVMDLVLRAPNKIGVFVIAAAFVAEPPVVHAFLRHFDLLLDGNDSAVRQSQNPLPKSVTGKKVKNCSLL
jgi:hypothetical protein